MSKVIDRYKSEDRLTVEEYIQVLRELEGKATTAEIAQAAGRWQETVSRVLGDEWDKGEEGTKKLGDKGVAVERETIGSAHLYKIREDGDTDD